MTKLVATGLAAIALLGAACSSTEESGDDTTTTTAAAATASTAGTTADAVTTIEAGSIDVVETDFGPALAVDGEQVVYTWDEETDLTSKCTADVVDAAGEPCDEKWPAVIVPSLAAVSLIGAPDAEFSVAERDDGTLQLAVDGRLLYTMALDGPGEANCQGGDGWYIVNPDGTSNQVVEPVDA